jgi:hypothetical protein
MSETFVQRVTRRVNDVAWRIEIWLANFEMNNVASFRFKRFRLYQNFKRGLGAEPGHAVGEAEFALCGQMHCGFI